jgi:hypothetical protein
MSNSPLWRVPFSLERYAEVIDAYFQGLEA